MTKLMFGKELIQISETPSISSNVYARTFPFQETRRANRRLQSNRMVITRLGTK